MKRNALLPLIALAVAACNETVTAPSTLRVPSSPSMAINGPNGAHLVTGTPTPSCTGTNSGVSCNSFEIAGVGNTNAVANLNNPVESHTTTFTVSTSSGSISPKNGRLTIPSLSVSPSSAPPQVCPNPNWTPVIRGGSFTLESFTYTVTFEGFTQPFISISGP
jgi:hypothetical protein